MPFLRGCLVAFLLALTMTAVGSSAYAADLKEALERFTTDDFSDSATAQTEWGFGRDDR